MDTLLRKFLPTSPAMLQAAQARLLEYANEAAVSGLDATAAHLTTASTSSSGSSARVHFESRRSRRGLNYVIATRAGSSSFPSSSSSLLLLHGYGYVCAYPQSFQLTIAVRLEFDSSLTLLPLSLQRWPGHVFSKFPILVARFACCGRHRSGGRGEDRQGQL